jgi:hypothetical protein
MPASAGDDEGNNMSKISINWNGIPLDCQYEYTPAEPGTRIDPPEPEWFEVSSALTTAGVDLMHEYEGDKITFDIVKAVRQHLEGNSDTTRHWRRI